MVPPFLAGVIEVSRCRLPRSLWWHGGGGEGCQSQVFDDRNDSDAGNTRGRPGGSCDVVCCHFGTTFGAGIDKTPKAPP